jgi:hypothetical protein
MADVKLSRSGYAVDTHTLLVRLTNGEEVIGVVNLLERNCQRVSELFTKDPTPFLVMCRCNTGHGVMFINKTHVLWAIPYHEK